MSELMSLIKEMFLTVLWANLALKWLTVIQDKMIVTGLFMDLHFDIPYSTRWRSILGLKPALFVTNKISHFLLLYFNIWVSPQPSVWLSAPNKCQSFNSGKYGNINWCDYILARTSRFYCFSMIAIYDRWKCIAYTTSKYSLLIHLQCQQFTNNTDSNYNIFPKYTYKKHLGMQSWE